MTRVHHPNPEEAGAVIYNEQGKIADRDFALLLVRGIGGVVDYFVARDSGHYPTSFIGKYGLELGIRISGAFQERDSIPRIVFYGSVEGRRTAKTLRRSGLEVPGYIEEIVLEGDIQQALYPYVPGVRQISPHRFNIFDFGNDVNAGHGVKELAQKLKLPLDRMLEIGNLLTFGESAMISGMIAHALEIKEEGGMHTVRSYKSQLLNEAFELMHPVEVAEFLWVGKHNIRQESIDYGKVLYRDSMHKLEERIRQCPNDKPESKRLMESSHAFLAQFEEAIGPITQ